MTKIVKMSLVAAVAVAGFTSNASAGKLIDAVEATSIAGFARYRMEDNSAADQQETDTYKMVIKTATDLGNGWTGNMRMQYQNKDESNSGATNTLDGDNKTFQVEDMYMKGKVGPVVLKLGKQIVGNPTAKVRNVTHPTTASGAVAIWKINPMFKVVGVRFTNLSLNDADVTAGKIVVNPIKGLNMWYWANKLENMSGVAASKEVNNDMAQISYKIACVTLTAQKATQDTNVAGDIDKAYTAYQADGKLGPVALKLGYSKTDKEGGYTGTAWFTTHAIIGAAWKSAGDVTDLADTKSTWLKASTNLGAFSLAATYVDLDMKAANTDMTEKIGEVGYKINKKLGGYVRFAKVEQDGNVADKDYGRLEIKYSF